MELGLPYQSSSTSSEAESKIYPSCPAPLGRQQHIILLGCFITFIVFLVIFFSVFFAWEVAPYRIIDRLAPVDFVLESATVQTEYQPQMVAKGVASVYSYDAMATHFQLQPLFKMATSFCGTKYSVILTTESEKRDSIQEGFIEKYSIDMSIYNRTSYTQYQSVNDWFSRELRPGARPVSLPLDNTIIVSPADARLMVFNNVPPDQQVWIKGSSFSTRTLLDTEEATYDNAAMAIVRLAPQDYHRFHSPVAGTIIKQYYVTGTLHSVNADAMTSKNDAQYNQRIVSIIQTAAHGNVAYVAIGAVCVGSIEMTRKEGAVVAKGEELGFFQFGGSTVAIVFPRGAGHTNPQWDEDIVSKSAQRVEVLVQMGSRIGQGV